jgi:acetylornithine deacetylase/succinyl-diaminopimelate desuccinylase-like protein
METIEEVVSQKHLDAGVDLAQALVSTPSVVGEEEPIGHVLEEWMNDLGLPQVELQEVEPGRYNAVATIDSGVPGPTIVLNGHMDTKTVCHGWDRDPYDAYVEDGRLHGHGVMDMKAGLASLIASAAAMHDSGAVTSGKVRVAAVCGHMAQQEGSVAFFERYPDADLCILGELSDLRVYLGHRGRIYFDVTTIGHAAHTYLREQAVSAVNQIARAVLAIDAIRARFDVDPEVERVFGSHLIHAVGRVYGGLPPDGPSMIPDRATLRVDCRVPPGVVAADVLPLITTVLDGLREDDPTFAYEVVEADVKSSYFIPAASPEVGWMVEAVQEATGVPAQITGVGWLGDTASFGHMVPTVIFGPGREPIYSANEWLDISDIHTSVRVYAGTMVRALAAASA